MKISDPSHTFGLPCWPESPHRFYDRCGAKYRISDPYYTLGSLHENQRPLSHFRPSITDLNQSMDFTTGAVESIESTSLSHFRLSTWNSATPITFGLPYWPESKHGFYDDCAGMYSIRDTYHTLGSPHEISDPSHTFGLLASHLSVQLSQSHSLSLSLPASLSQSNSLNLTLPVSPPQLHTIIVVGTFARIFIFFCCLFLSLSLSLFPSFPRPYLTMGPILIQCCCCFDCITLNKDLYYVLVTRSDLIVCKIKSRKCQQFSALLSSNRI